VTNSKYLDILRRKTMEKAIAVEHAKKRRRKTCEPNKQ
jgi:hypothetical protein